MRCVGEGGGVGKDFKKQRKLLPEQSNALCNVTLSLPHTLLHITPMTNEKRHPTPNTFCTMTNTGSYSYLHCLMQKQNGTKEKLCSIV